MGLLLGRWTKVKEKDVAYIEAISISRRLDKLKDRVEISPEQLMHAMNEVNYSTIYYIFLIKICYLLKSNYYQYHRVKNYS